MPNPDVTVDTDGLAMMREAISTMAEADTAGDKAAAGLEIVLASYRMAETVPVSGAIALAFTPSVIIDQGAALVSAGIMDHPNMCQRELDATLVSDEDPAVRYVRCAIIGAAAIFSAYPEMADDDFVHALRTHSLAHMPRCENSPRIC